MLAGKRSLVLGIKLQSRTRRSHRRKPGRLQLYLIVVMHGFSSHTYLPVCLLVLPCVH